MEDTSYKEMVTRKLREIKFCPKAEIDRHCIPIFENEVAIARFRPITIDSIDDDKEVRLLSEWRKLANPQYFSQFPVTFEGTRRWMKNALMDVEDRILFMIEIPGGVPVGHLGLNRFNFKDRECENDNLIRGVRGGHPRLMFFSVAAMIQWAFDELGVVNSRGQVISSNAVILRIVGRLGYEETERLPLKKTVRGDVVEWEVFEPSPGEEIERYAIKMQLPLEKWRRTWGRR